MISESKATTIPTAVIAGAQRFDPNVLPLLEATGITGPVATITAGWQEREDEDDELREHLDREAINLRLRARAEEAFVEDPELRKAHRKRQQMLRHKQDFYRIRLEHELEANHVIRQRKAPGEILEQEERASLAAIRNLDDYHLAQCARVQRDFDENMGTYERPSIARHRSEIKEVLSGCKALLIAGGHVASLLNRLRLFGIRNLLESHAVIAWSAGAMAISPKIVLFHDNPPQGPGASEVLDAGLGLMGGVVPLPQPEQRLRLDDSERVSVLARRFAPDLCLAFPARAHLRLSARGYHGPSGVLHLRPDGSVVPFEEGTL